MKRIAIAAIAAVSLAACTGGGEPSTTAGPSITSLADADQYCVMVIDGILLDSRAAESAGEIQDLLSSPLNAANGLDIDAVNAAGQTLVDIALERRGLYLETSKLVDDGNVVEAYDTLREFNEIFSIAVGSAAADATSFEHYSERAAEIATNPQIQVIVDTIADAAKTVADYTATRCSR